MLSRENKIILAFGTVALIATYAGYALTEVDDAILVGILLFVGVVVPVVLNNYLDDSPPA